MVSGSTEMIPLFERGHFCFQQDSFFIIEVNISFDNLLSFAMVVGFNPTQAFFFEVAKKNSLFLHYRGNWRVWTLMQ